jgi:hypothetical protein
MAFMRDPLYILMQDGAVQIVNTRILGEDDQAEVEDQIAEHGSTYMSQQTFDAIVMMRYYNMSEEERRAAIKRALETQFETGADGVRKASGLPTVMERVDMEVERRQTAAYGGSR